LNLLCHSEQFSRANRAGNVKRSSVLLLSCNLELRNTLVDVVHRKGQTRILGILFDLQKTTRLIIQAKMATSHESGISLRQFFSFACSRQKNNSDIKSRVLGVLNRIHATARSSPKTGFCWQRVFRSFASRRHMRALDLRFVT
jgi:hypothetical protein